MPDVALNFFGGPNLSLTIMFVFKRFMIVDESWQNHESRSRNCKQAWRAQRSAILVAFEIFVKKLRVEEAYQETIRMNYETFCEIFTATLVIFPLASSAGVLLVRAKAKSSRSFVRPAIFDLQLEWTVGVGGGGGEKRRSPEEAVKMP